MYSRSGFATAALVHLVLTEPQPYTRPPLGGSTDYAAPYADTRFLRTARTLFGLWIEARDDLQPGDEYKLVDRFAETLRLQLMCLMYVGLKDIDPTVDTGMDLEEPYQAALLLHNAQQ